MCSKRDDYKVGKDLQERGDVPGALASFRKVVEKNPEHVKAWKKIGGINIRENRFDDAVEAYRNALKIEPGEADVRVLLALALSKAGKAAEAEAIAREALAMPEIKRDAKIAARLEQLLLDGLKPARPENHVDSATTPVVEPVPSTIPEASVTTGAGGAAPESAAGGETSATTPLADAFSTASAVVAEEVSTGPVESEAVPCVDLPKGILSDEELKRLIPADSPGRVFIRWRTETQEENYGFHIYRADAVDGPYKRINKAIIPGEGSTNIPKDYCLMDTPLPRGRVFFYYIESITNQGVAEVVEGTMGTRVKVKTVDEEREWLRKKAAGNDAKAAAPPATPASPSPTLAPLVTIRPPVSATVEPAVQGVNPLE
jgi:hypothetical protein